MGEGGNDSAEVRISLVADDMSEAITKAVREGMQGVREEAEKAKEATGENGLVGSILKADIEFEALKKAAELVTETIHEAYEMMEMLGDAAAEAAEEQAEQERAMTGNLFLLDRGVHSMKDLHDYAADTREEMAQFGIEAGVSAGKMADAFNQMTARGNMGSEKAKELAEQMAVVGKVVPGGMESLAQGMAGIELGMVRARNPIVQLIAATHELKGNAYQVAHQMEKMTPEKQMEKANAAIEKQAAMLGKFGEGVGPPLMSELKTSFEGVKEGFMESMGNRMQESLIPKLVELRHFLVEHTDAINEIGLKIGVGASRAIEYVENAIQGIYEGIHQDWDEILHIVDEFKAAWGIIFQHSADTRTQFRILADDLVIAVHGMLRAVEAAEDIVKGQQVGTTAAEAQGKIAEEAAGKARTPEGQERANQEIAKYNKMVGELGDSMYQNYGQMKAINDAIQDSTESGKAMAEAFAGIGGGNMVGTDDASDKFTSMVADAVNTQNEGTEEYAFSLLAGSEAARQALIDGTDKIHGGLEALMEEMEKSAPELADQIKKMLNPLSKEGGVHAPANINFHNAKFDIKQDFKDQDPDRVIVTFKRDVQRAAMNRLESRFAQPFGV